MHDCPGRVGEGAQILGFAGLLPQVAAAAVTTVDHHAHLGAMFAFGYASLIVSFLGGMWWGFAMHRTSRQAELAGLAVVPSIVAAVLILGSIAGMLSLPWALVLLGSVVMLTLLVDRWLEGSHDAPHGWLAMRAPLSLALGGLTVLTGILTSF